MKDRIARLLKAAIEYDRSDVRRIFHLTKVHDMAALLGKMERLDADEQDVLEAAAVLHDIGIHLSEKKYGSSAGHYQEKEGPAEALLLLKQTAEWNATEMERICFLVGHHHTYHDIQGMDYQLLVEADFLVNIQEDSLSPDRVSHIRERIFRSRSGLQLLDALYGGHPWEAAPAHDACHGMC